jgi:hypothetical protein
MTSESLAVERDGWSRQDSSLLDRASQKCSTKQKGKKKKEFLKITQESMYENNITRISSHKSELKTDKMNVPVIFHIEEKLMPEQATMEQLESVASNDCVFHHIAAMADVHSKPGRKNATGTTVTSEKYPPSSQ